MRAPLVVPALLFLDAIVVARDSPLGCALAFGVLAGAATLLGGTPAQLVAAGAVAVGLALGEWRGQLVEIDREIPGAVIRGVVVGDVSPQPWGDSFELVSEDGSKYAIALRERVAIGERIVVQGRLEPFDDARNPDEPPAILFARERGLSGRLAEARLLARAPPDPHDLRTIPARLRKAASDALHRSLAEPDATILAGMLYGARGTLSRELRAEFQDTGTVHVLVTAGLHLGVVAALFAWLFARIGLGRVSASLATIPIVWTYAILSGSHVPSLRAATMVTVALTARALGERAISLNALALAAIVVAAIWPAWVGGASFGLSFSCVGAIVLFAEPITTQLERLRVPHLFREPLALTLATQIGVWPLTAATFLVIAPYAPLANLFVVPVVGIALIGGLALLAASPLGALATIVGRIETWPLAWIESVVHVCAHSPFAHVIATPAPTWALAVYDLAMVAVALIAQLRR